MLTRRHWRARHTRTAMKHTPTGVTASRPVTPPIDRISTSTAMVSPASHLRGADRHGESVAGHEAVGDCPYHRPEMRITYLFLPLYFGLFAGLVGHSVRAGLVGAAVGLLLAVLLSAEGNRRGRADGMAAIDAMTGTEFEDYVAARLQRAGWRVQVHAGERRLRRRPDRRQGRQVGGGAVQATRQARRRRGGSAGGGRCTPPRMHQEHRHQQSGIHRCGQTTGPYPQLSIDRSQGAASLGTASCATHGLGLARSLAKANSGDGDYEATSGARCSCAAPWR